MTVYPRTPDTEVPAQPGFPALERDVLAHWRAHDIFRASVRERPADQVINLFDGMVADDARIVPSPRQMTGVSEVMELRG